ncbi:MAG: hypothetical protein ABTQ31_06410 [Rhizobiaceae bacterium]
MRSHLATLAVVALAFCAACLPSKGQRDPEIVTGTIGEQEYFVPRAYLKLPSRALSEDNIYVLAFYPDFRPAWDRHNAIWRDGKWKYKVRILASYSATPANIEVHARNTASTLRATQLVGIEYGLAHFTQPEGQASDHRDMWIEHAQTDNGDVLSYTTCSEKLIERDNPQCTLYMNWNGGFFVRSSFNKSMLKNWSDIKRQTIELLESFQSRELAISYINSKPTHKPILEE